MEAEGGKRRPRDPGCVILALREMYTRQVLSYSKKLKGLKHLSFRCSKQKKDNVFSAARAAGVFKKSYRARSLAVRTIPSISQQLYEWYKSLPSKARKTKTHFYWKLRTLYEQYKQETLAIGEEPTGFNGVDCDRAGLVLFFISVTQAALNRRPNPALSL